VIPEVPPNIWLGAAGMAARVTARPLRSSGSNQSPPERVLPDEHFEFRGVAAAGKHAAGPRRAAGSAGLPLLILGQHIPERSPVFGVGFTAIGGVRSGARSVTKLRHGGWHRYLHTAVTPERGDP